jgi:DtxR family Mn-dependent transcriptional regulator
MAMEGATAAEEEYLESLFWLFEAGLPMTGANLARAMQLSAPTVHDASTPSGSSAATG